MINNRKWIPLKEKEPEVEGYFEVKFDDGTTDAKPFRIRPSKGIRGFMTEKNVTHWKGEIGNCDALPID